MIDDHHGTVSAAAHGRTGPRATLPASTVRSTAWRGRAACRGTDPNIWQVSFPGGTISEPSVGQAPRAQELERLELIAHANELATRYCATCPVAAQCRDAAIAENDQDAVRGGMTPRQRRDWARQQKAQRAMRRAGGLAAISALREVTARPIGDNQLGVTV